MKHIFCISLVFILFSSFSSSQSIIRVPQDYTTIQGAINAAVNGDTVLVDAGTYIENIRYNGRKITVASHYLLAGDTSLISATIIDGSTPTHPDSGSVVRFDAGTDSTSALIGFTIRGGKGIKLTNPGDGWVWYVGGGVSITGTGARIVHNRIVDNVVSGKQHVRSGAISAWNSASTNENAATIIVEHNVIEHNRIDGTFAEAGAMGIGMSGRLVGNVIVDNEANGTTSFAGALSIWGNAEIQIVNNIIARNNGGNEDGAMWIYNYSGRYPDITLVNNTIVYNRAKFTCRGIDFTGSTIRMMNNIIWNPGPFEEVFGYTEGASSNLIRSGYFGTNNISADPSFADMNTYELADNSPCLGAGSKSLMLSGRIVTAPETDIDGNLRPTPAGSAPDLGSRESGVTGGSPAAGQPHYVKRSMRFGGVDRWYYLYLPTAYDGVKKLPVVYFMHGSGGSPSALMLFGFSTLADSLGFVLVSPKSLDVGWDNPLDVNFLSTLIDTINSQYAVNPTRVFLTGYSSGGIMSFRMAALSSRRIAGIGPVVGAIPYDIGGGRPPREVPLIYFAATNDQSVLWNGTGALMSAPVSVATWLGFNGCSADADTVNLPDIDPTDGVTTTRISYKCGTPIRWYILNNGEHGWPGPYLMASYMSRDINATLEILKFFAYVDSTTAGGIDFSQSSIDFGNVILSTADTAEFVITNANRIPVSITSVQPQRSEYSVVCTPTLPALISSGEALKVRVAFHPVMAGMVYDSLQVLSDDSASKCVLIPLRGRGLESVVHAAEGVLYAVQGGIAQSGLYTITLPSLQTTHLGDLGNWTIRTAVIHPSLHEIYAVGMWQGSTSLFRISADSGAAVRIRSIPISNVEGITFGRGDTLYGVASDGGLFRIDPGTGVVTTIGEKNGFAYSALAFSHTTGQLWAAAGHPKDSLYLLNPTTGTATRKAKLPFDSPTLSLAFDNSGTLYGLLDNGSGENYLVTIDTSSGEASVVGTSSIVPGSMRAIAIYGTTVNVEAETQLPTSYSLEQNYPNPFNPVTNVEFRIKNEGKVKLAVYDLLGREVAVLVNERKPVGRYEVTWDASRMASGIYCYRLMTGSFVGVKKMILLK